MLPQYDIDKIKYGTDAPTFEKAVGLYEKGKVTKVKEEFGGYSAIVIGTHPYQVSISSQNYDHGNCNCYLGENEILCKHMVALAIYAVKKGHLLTENDKKFVDQPICSGKKGLLEKGTLSLVKKSISEAMRYIKAYNGPSRTWFNYQNSLSEGCHRLSKIISDLPVSEQTSKLVIDTLLRLDKKLCTGGVDDSDGTVGNFIEETVIILKEYIKIDSDCIKSFYILKDKKTCFGWEEPLVNLIK